MRILNWSQIRVCPIGPYPTEWPFSPDGESFFLAETFGSCIRKYRYNRETGIFSQGEVFLSLPEEKGYPDGIVLDGRGGVWMGHWQGFRISRFRNDGCLDREYTLPVPSPTSMCLTRQGDLYITSAIKGCSDEQLRLCSDAGKLFMIKTPYSGLNEFGLQFLKKSRLYTNGVQDGFYPVESCSTVPSNESVRVQIPPRSYRQTASAGPSVWCSAF